jgi:hypothetical protein
MSYKQPTSADITATLGDIILWFDLGANLIKQSTDNGSNWTTWAGAGPIAQYYGNGANITNILPYAQVGFLTRDNLQKIYQTALDNSMPDYNAGVSKNTAVEYTAESNGVIIICFRIQTNRTIDFYMNGSVFLTIPDREDSYNVSITRELYIPILKGSTYKLTWPTNGANNLYSYNFYPLKGALK